MKGEGIDVVQRQRGDQDLATFIEVGAHQRPTLQHVGHQVTVGEHGALGHPGGAAGVLQHGNIIAVGARFFHRLAGTFAQYIIELQRLGQVVGRDHFLHVLDHAVDQQALYRWQHIGHFGDNNVLDLGLGHYLFRQVRHVGQAHQRFGAGIIELVLHFPCGIQRVGVHHDQACTQGPKDCYWVLQQVGQLHGDAIAGLQIGMVLQVGGKGPRQLIQLAVGNGFAQVAKGWFVSKALAGLFQYCLDIRVLIGVDLRRNPGWVLILPKIFDHGSPLLQHQRILHRSRCDYY
ncbi:hypothetical protein D3C78_1194590 [compost metagenome]